MIDGDGVSPFLPPPGHSVVIVTPLGTIVYPRPISASSAALMSVSVSDWYASGSYSALVRGLPNSSANSIQSRQPHVAKAENQTRQRPSPSRESASPLTRGAYTTNRRG